MEAIMRFERLLPFAVILITLLAGVLNVLPAIGDDHRHRNRYRERHRDNEHGITHLKPVSDPTYKDKCGDCHFPYQPELLPSSSWKNILDRPNDHFGASIELDEESKKNILGYLETNAAEHSNAKRAVKITRSVEAQVPTRITEIPYIREKHHDISAATIKRQSIGSLSNCTACHTRAREGIYDDDFVVIPE
jgi:hypothetical protein